MKKETTESIIEILQRTPKGFRIPKRSKDCTIRPHNLFDEDEIPNAKKKKPKTIISKKSK